MTSIAERYLSSTQTSNLRVQAEKMTDADTLLAAAYATAGDPRRIMALDVYRLRANGTMRGAHAISQDLGRLLRQQVTTQRGGHLRNRGANMKLIQASDLAFLVLKWWHRPACPVCNGIGHPMIPDTPVADMSVDCPACEGTGQSDINTMIKREHREHAQWLISEIDGLCSLVFSDMARLLSQRMNL